MNTISVWLSRGAEAGNAAVNTNQHVVTRGRRLASLTRSLKLVSLVLCQSWTPCPLIGLFFVLYAGLIICISNSMHYANEFAVGRRLSSENSSTFRILQGLATGASTGRSSLANAICCTPTPTFLKWLPSLLMMLFNPTPLQQLRHLINSSRARAFPSSSPSAEVWGRCSFVSSISSQSELKISSKCPPLRRSNPSKPVPIKLNPSESPPSRSIQKILRKILRVDPAGRSFGRSSTN